MPVPTAEQEALQSPTPWLLNPDEWIVRGLSRAFSNGPNYTRSEGSKGSVPTAQQEALQSPNPMLDPVNWVTMILGGMLPKLMAGMGGGGMASQVGSKAPGLPGLPGLPMVRMGPESLLRSSQILGSTTGPIGTEATHPLINQIIHELVTNRGISNYNIGDIMRYQVMRPGMDFYKSAYGLPSDMADLTPNLSDMLRQMIGR